MNRIKRLSAFIKRPIAQPFSSMIWHQIGGGNIFFGQKRGSLKGIKNALLRRGCNPAQVLDVLNSVKDSHFRVDKNFPFLLIVSNDKAYLDSHNNGGLPLRIINDGRGYYYSVVLNVTF